MHTSKFDQLLDVIRYAQGVKEESRLDQSLSSNNSFKGLSDDLYDQLEKAAHYFIKRVSGAVELYQGRIEEFEDEDIDYSLDEISDYPDESIESLYVFTEKTNAQLYAEMEMIENETRRVKADLLFWERCYLAISEIKKTNTTITESDVFLSQLRVTELRSTLALLTEKINQLQGVINNKVGFNDDGVTKASRNTVTSESYKFEHVTNGPSKVLM